MEASNCSRCNLKDDKLCYQHMVSYLFPISKRNKNAHNLISAKIEEGTLEIESSNSKQRGSTSGDLKECTPGVCENVSEKNGEKTVSIEGENDRNGVEESGVENPERVSGEGEEGGSEVSRKRRRTEKGAGFYRNLSGKFEKAVKEKKEKKKKKKKKDRRNYVLKNGDVVDALPVFGQEGNGVGGVEKSDPIVCENGVEEKENDSPSLIQEFGKKIKAKLNDQISDDTDDTVGIKINMNTCHQCHRNDKGRVVKCTKCNVKRYCIGCIKNWYPLLTEEQIAEACPICRENCNCKTCLRMEGPIKNRVKDGFTIGQEVKNEHSKYLLRIILPFLEQINQEQMTEKDLEAKIQSVSASELRLQNANCHEKERVFCNNCKDFILDFHRSCPICKYILCLACCREVRAGQLQGFGKLIKEYVERGSQYLHGKTAPVQPKKSAKVKKTTAKLEEKATCKSTHTPPERGRGAKDALASSERINGYNSPELQLDDQNKAKPKWSVNKSGAISCPRSYKKGCSGAYLELKTILSDGWLSEMLNKAEQTLATWGDENQSHNSEGCSCSVSPDCMRKCASREGSKDNHLYCPDALVFQQGGLKHFQWHWTFGEPIIIRNVLKTAPGLSWEPMVIWRAFRQIGNRVLILKALNCLDGSEVKINAHQFFKYYSLGQDDNVNQPAMLKLRDWPPNGKFEQRLPRHCAEFIRALPFKEYTHPRDGVLNLATKWPIKTLMPDLGPKAYIAYGHPQELDCGDSVTNLHFHMSDVVNILVHATDATLPLGNGAHPSGSLEDHDNGGALWDIFRREDVAKLQKFLRKHYRELRHNHYSSQKKAIHPLLDQTFYLTKENKGKLKAEYGIEPWTFVQNLGEAVLIPAGCPHQVKNLKSCIKIALDFFSPENIHESLRLTEELRILPRRHSAKANNLEVRKMIIHSVTQALNDLEMKQE